MNPEKQRIKIALHCGWKQENDVLFYNESLKRYAQCPDVITCNSLPDYLNELNACRDAWLTLSLEQKVKCLFETAKIVERDYVARNGRDEWNLLSNEDVRALCENATAPQRCEAFLRTIGQWEEEC